MNFFPSLLNALPGALAQGLIWGLMAIGVYITFKVLDLADLTVDGTMCTGGAVCIILMTHGVNVWVAMLCAFIAGMIAGAVTGLFHTVMGIPAILAGILTQLALFSMNLRIMGGKANQAINPDKYDLLVSLRNVKKLSFENPILVTLIFTAVVIALLYWFFGTEVGSGIRATGANPNMSRAQGINVDRNKVLGLMLSNGIVALSSALYTQYQGFADVNAGRGAIVIGLAAVIIGDVIFSRIFRNFALKLALRVHRCRHLLRRHPDRPDHGPEQQRLEALLRPGGGCVPGRALLEEQAHPEQSEARSRKGGAPCLN